MLLKFYLSQIVKVKIYVFQQQLEFINYEQY